MPSTFEHLRDNVHLNDLCEQTNCRNVGVGKEQSSLQFTADSGAENRVLRDAGSNRGIEVPVVTLDGLYTEKCTPDDVLVVKVDVEGWEADVLRGADQVLSRSAPTALIVALDGSGSRYGFDDGAAHNYCRP